MSSLTMSSRKSQKYDSWLCRSWVRRVKYFVFHSWLCRKPDSWLCRSWVIYGINLGNCQGPPTLGGLLITQERHRQGPLKSGAPGSFPNCHILIRPWLKVKTCFERKKNRSFIQSTPTASTLKAWRLKFWLAFSFGLTWSTSYSEFWNTHFYKTIDAQFGNLVVRLKKNKNDKKSVSLKLFVVSLHKPYLRIRFFYRKIKKDFCSLQKPLVNQFFRNIGSLFWKCYFGTIKYLRPP
jgi:hypothetical protein